MLTINVQTTEENELKIVATVDTLYSRFCIVQGLIDDIREALNDMDSSTMGPKDAESYWLLLEEFEDVETILDRIDTLGDHAESETELAFFNQPKQAAKMSDQKPLAEKLCDTCKRLAWDCKCKAKPPTPKPDTERPMVVWIEGDTVIRPNKGPWCAIGAPYVPKSAFDAVNKCLGDSIKSASELVGFLQDDIKKLETDLAISRDAYEMQKRVSERLEKERDEVLEKALNALKQFSNVDLWANTCCGCDPAYYPRASIEDKTFSMAELAEKILEEIDQTIKKIKGDVG